MSKIKYLVVGFGCFILGTALLQPAFGHIVASKNAHTLSKRHLSYFASSSWTKKYYLKKTTAASTYFRKSGGTISGMVTSNGYNLATPKTGYLTIPGTDFVATSGSPASYTPTNAYSDTGNLAVAVNLPNGAIITQVTYYYYDGSAGSDSSVALRRNALGSGASYSDMANASSSGSGTYGSASDDSINDATIDNSALLYHLAITGANAITNAVQAVRITYTYNSL